MVIDTEKPMEFMQLSQLFQIIMPKRPYPNACIETDKGGMVYLSYFEKRTFQDKTEFVKVARGHFPLYANADYQLTELMEFKAKVDKAQEMRTMVGAAKKIIDNLITSIQYGQ